MEVALIRPPLPIEPDLIVVPVFEEHRRSRRLAGRLREMRCGVPRWLCRMAAPTRPRGNNLPPQRTPRSPHRTGGRPACRASPLSGLVKRDLRPRCRAWSQGWRSPVSSTEPRVPCPTGIRPRARVAYPSLSPATNDQQPAKQGCRDGQHDAKQQPARHAVEDHGDLIHRLCRLCGKPALKGNIRVER